MVTSLDVWIQVFIFIIHKNAEFVKQPLVDNFFIAKRISLWYNKENKVFGGLR